MLIDFTLDNYKSFKEPQSFSMLASAVKEKNDNFFHTDEKDIKLLKSTVLYGANASGKTNLIKGLENCINFIKNSTDIKAGQNIPYYFPFKLDVTYQSRPSFFEIEFITSSKVRYKYSVLFDSERVVEESLVFYPKRQETRLFYRKAGQPMKFGDALKGPKRAIEELLNENVLFLSKAANSNNQMLKEVYTYFDNYLLLLLSSSSDLLQQVFTPRLIFNNKDFKNKVVKFINDIDVGIKSIHVEERGDDHFKAFINSQPQESIKKVLQNAYKYKTYTVHECEQVDAETKEILFDLEEESDGTRKLFNLSGLILTVFETGGTVVIDELNNGLHPKISNYIVRLFNDPKTNPLNAQLILTSHDTSLLDKDIFRRDQIWFVEKNRAGASEVYSMSEFDFSKVRKNIPFDKWYLSGKFGGLPLINDVHLDYNDA